MNCVNQKGTLRARQRGMYFKEAKVTKCCYLVGFAFSAIVYIVIGSLHGNRSVNAENINKEYLHLRGDANKAYDTC